MILFHAAVKNLSRILARVRMELYKRKLDFRVCHAVKGMHSKMATAGQCP